jgi:hypothetical protein
MSVQITTQPTFSAARPRPLFSRRFAQTITGADYDVSPDGECFVMLNPGEQERAATEISVLLNWFAELNQKVPGKCDGDVVIERGARLGVTKSSPNLAKAEWAKCIARAIRSCRATSR